MAVPEHLKNALEFICAAAEEGSLAAMEVNEIDPESCEPTGEVAYLLVGVRQREDGGADIAPLARLDVDFSTFAPEGGED